MEELKIVSYADITAEPVRFLWEPYVARGKITILQGDPGSGKTTLALAIAAAVTTGAPLPNAVSGAASGGVASSDVASINTLISSANCATDAPRSVIFLSAEDGARDTIKPKLERFGADCARVFMIDDAGAPLTFTDWRIERAIVETGAAVCFLDPTQGFLENLYNIGAVRAAMKHLAAVAERTDCAIVLVGHLNKKGGKSAYRGLGSIDIYAAARSVLTVGKLSSDENIRVMVHNKSNLTAPGAAQAFGLSADGDFIWLGEHDITVDELLSGKQNEKPESQFAKARRLLETELSGGQVVAAVEIMEHADIEGVSLKTLHRAKSALGIISTKRGGQWFWQLPIDVVYTEYPDEGSQNEGSHGEGGRQDGQNANQDGHQDGQSVIQGGHEDGQGGQFALATLNL